MTMPMYEAIRIVFGLTMITWGAIGFLILAHH
jgi:hypothetical protein